MTTRLATVAEDLSELLATQPERIQRDVAAKAARWALSEMAISDPRLDAARKALDHHAYGPSTVTDDLTALLDELDETAFDLQDAGDDDGYSDAFDRARAVNALLFALDPDAREAAMEASYEALMSRENGIEDFRALVHSLLDH